MSLTSHQKRGLFWGLGILMAVVLMSAAWSQINTALTHASRCFEDAGFEGVRYPPSWAVSFGFFLGYVGTALLRRFFRRATGAK